MQQRKILQTVTCFGYAATFTGAAAYVASKGSVLVADWTAASHFPPLAAEAILTVGGPLAALVASTSITSMARGGHAASHQKIAAIAGGMIVAIPLIAMTVMGEQSISYNPAQRLMDTQNMVIVDGLPKYDLPMPQ